MAAAGAGCYGGLRIRCAPHLWQCTHWRPTRACAVASGAARTSLFSAAVASGTTWWLPAAAAVGGLYQTDHLGTGLGGGCRRQPTSSTLRGAPSLPACGRRILSERWWLPAAVGSQRSWASSLPAAARSPPT